MDRRNFFKIITVTTAGAATTACGSKDALIPLLVPEHNIPIGEERWHPAVCTECAAGCGTLVRVMGAERVIEQKGEQVRQRVAAIKKIEGNPLDPISGGRLCARGQAVVQALYHPDRLHGAMKKQGDRKSPLTPVSWGDATAAAADKIRTADPSRVVFLTGPNAGSRSAAIGQFLKAIKAPAASICSLADFAIERKAAEEALGWHGLPVYDIANATHVLSVGADFLGGWASPVYYARQFGNFRQGRPGIRGNLFHAESRFSVTATAADRWLPIAPGSEPQFIAAIARILIDAKLAPNVSALPAAVAQAFRGADVPSLLKASGLEPLRTLPIVLEFGSSRTPLMVAGASAVHTNSLDAVVASHYLNLMLGNIGKPGGVLAPATGAVPLENTELAGRLANAQVILIDGANPAYTMPKSSGIVEALNRADLVISFAPIVDDTAAYADFILPDHHALESATAVAPMVSAGTAIALAEPFVLPLYDTQALEKTLSDIAGKLNASYTPSTLADLIKPLLKSEKGDKGDATYEETAREGGVWLAPDAKPAAPRLGKDMPLSAPAFSGDASQFPLFFQPYLSLQFHDGSSSHLPWMQELPDPTSSAIWSIPVEIDPKTASSLGIAEGDLVRVESPNGAIEAPAFIHPAAIPGVLSMAIGAGHTHFGRYASDRGANPLSILSASAEKTTGAIATGATRVKLTRVSDAGRLIQFSTQKRENRGFGYR
jgi:anaerobic selenocysteine-containing dehydrogenase